MPPIHPRGSCGHLTTTVRAESHSGLALSQRYSRNSDSRRNRLRTRRSCWRSPPLENGAKEPKDFLKAFNKTHEGATPTMDRLNLETNWNALDPMDYVAGSLCHRLPPGPHQSTRTSKKGRSATSSLRPLPG